MKSRNSTKFEAPRQGAAAGFRFKSSVGAEVPLVSWGPERALRFFGCFCEHIYIYTNTVYIYIYGAPPLTYRFALLPAQVAS